MSQNDDSKWVFFQQNLEIIKQTSHWLGFKMIELNILGYIFQFIRIMIISLLFSETLCY